jgi:hypothetical protein
MKAGDRAALQRRAIWIYTIVGVVLAVLIYFRVIPRDVAGASTGFAVGVWVFTGVVSIVFNLNRSRRWR